MFRHVEKCIKMEDNLEVSKKKKVKDQDSLKRSKNKGSRSDSIITERIELLLESKKYYFFNISKMEQFHWIDNSDSNPESMNEESKIKFVVIKILLRNWDVELVIPMNVVITHKTLLITSHVIKSTDIFCLSCPSNYNLVQVLIIIHFNWTFYPNLVFLIPDLPTSSPCSTQLCLIF